MGRRRVFRQDLPAPAPGPFTCALEITRCVAHNQRDGRRCRRRTVRHPFCLSHARSLCGVTVGRSPIAGCGLFATRPLAVGDVIVPYTGEEFRDVWDLQRRQGRRGTPFAMGLSQGRIVEASCRRGLGAYINQPRPRGDGGANVAAVQLTLNWPADARCFGPADRRTGLCPVRSVRELRAGNRFWAKGWRRVPEQLLLRRRFRHRSYVWLVVRRAVPAGGELLLRYNDPDVLRVSHRTVPSVC